MIRKIKKILLLMLIFVLTYNHFCYADIISTRAMTGSVSLMGGFLAAFVFAIYATTYFGVRLVSKEEATNDSVNEKVEIDEDNKPNEQDGKTEVVEKINLRDECEDKLYLWGMILICCISYTCFAMFNLPFALMVIPIIFSAYAFTLRKIDKKKAKLFSIIAFITMIILMIVSGMAYDAYIEKRMRDLALSFVIKYV